ncbi:hypothetical protein GCG54_00010561 [Colletotrichum gloeosporioides]|uniref:Uncharacterized protein n=1 Tax=Colletotrichum gloeosporioides TaxID=474922 RepID=A0A8H4FEN1_COLGL|nr:uncharacterized protein GCG54_00010561 [Colletotrichum gloeosporioides]KAF3798214.1 hypothetical protein GCG54_00010561 [Colletotrichum gloeosporioides]
MHCSTENIHWPSDSLRPVLLSHGLVGRRRIYHALPRVVLSGLQQQDNSHRTSEPRHAFGSGCHDWLPHLAVSHGVGVQQR